MSTECNLSNRLLLRLHRHPCCCSSSNSELLTSGSFPCVRYSSDDAVVIYVTMVGVQQLQNLVPVYLPVGLLVAIFT